LDLDGTGRVAAADDVERDECERADRGRERDAQSPAQARAGAAHRAPPRRFGRKQTLELGVEGGAVLGSVELTEGGAEPLVADGRHAAPPSAVRREARARLSRDATVPSGTPSTCAASR
jgi:hypothetical protein